ncbi:MAG: nucleotidyl transferase AbiEii/AbiGii toxin family protein [Sandaracinaceae bacterium]|nr:nucleotidyl transferase AbiEii/AbiGii toxin family protein [Sandaracinaceae bacterium]
MIVYPDFADLLRAFVDYRVEFLVVGAHALAVHGHSRATKDLDVWVRPSKRNAARLLRALDEFGAPTRKLAIEDFSVPGIVFQIGSPPVRIDVITEVSGLRFAPAWKNRVSTRYGGLDIFVLSRKDLIANKTAAGRPQDLVDLEALRRKRVG